MDITLRTQNAIAPDDFNGLSGDLWPIHLKPKEDELLSSWIVRIARSYELKLHTFCNLIWPGKQIWNRDIDKLADDEILRVLSEKTATYYERVFETTLRAYEGRLYENHNPYGNTPWIMPIGVYHRTRRRYGLQYCPECLASDEEPYFRRRWRLAFITVCERHCSLLQDRCPRCGSPVNFHRNPYDAESITLCHMCKFDLRRAAPIGGDFFNQLHYQLVLSKAAEQGWIFLPGRKPVYSHLYFTVLHQVMKLLSKPDKARKLRRYICRGIMTGRSHTPVRRERRRLSVEEMGLTARFALMALVGWVLADWPYRFVYLCRLSGLLSANLLKDMKQVPYWYWKAIYENLYEPDRHPSDLEILAAIDHLRRSNVKMGPYSVSKVLGFRQAFRKSKKKFSDYLRGDRDN